MKTHFKTEFSFLMTFRKDYLYLNKKGEISTKRFPNLNPNHMI